MLLKMSSQLNFCAAFMKFTNELFMSWSPSQGRTMSARSYLSHRRDGGYTTSQRGCWRYGGGFASWQLLWPAHLKLFPIHRENFTFLETTIAKTFTFPLHLSVWGSMVVMTSVAIMLRIWTSDGTHLIVASSKSFPKGSDAHLVYSSRSSTWTDSDSVAEPLSIDHFESLPKPEFHYTITAFS